jgi:hypothetical protein
MKLLSVWSVAALVASSPAFASVFTFSCSQQTDGGQKSEFKKLFYTLDVIDSAQDDELYGASLLLVDESPVSILDFETKPQPRPGSYLFNVAALVGNSRRSFRFSAGRDCDLAAAKKSQVEVVENGAASQTLDCKCNAN